MSNLNDIIQVTITRETKPTSQQGFSTVLIVGSDATFSERVRYYSSNDLVGLAADLTDGTGANEYLAATAISSQNPKIPLIGIGREDASDVSMTATLNAVYAESQDFYGIVTADRDSTSKIEQAGSWALANERLYCNASDQTAIIDETEILDTSSLSYTFKNTSNSRVSMFYKSDASATSHKYTDAAYLGQVLAYTPGSWSGMAKTLPGEAADTLTPTQSINAHDKYTNSYEEIGENNVVLNGWVSSGEYTDIIVFADWLKARITENVWSIMINAPKLPYTDEGIVAIENAVKQILDIGQKNGGISPHSFDSVTKVRTGGYETEVPLASAVTANDKANRILRNVKFTAWLAGAIHTTIIEGILTL